MTTRRLYDITEDFLAFETLMIEAEGEWSDAAEAILADLETERDRKVDGYCALLQEWKVEEANLKALAEHYRGRAKTLANSQQALKDRLAAALALQGVERVKTPRFAVTVSTTPATVALRVDAEALPEQYRREKHVIEADKTALKEALADGPLVDDDGRILAEMQSGRPTVRIR